MRKSLTYLVFTVLSLWLMLLVSACGGGETTVTATPLPTTAPALDTPSGDIAPRPTITPDMGGSGYPAPTIPEPTPFPEGYPVPSPVTELLNPYPEVAGFVWMMHPAGLQCESSLVYGTLEEALQALQGAGVTAQNGRSTNLNVCAACNCPTSLHYQAQIATADVAKAETLGWTTITP